MSNWSQNKHNTLIIRGTGPEKSLIDRRFEK